MLSNIRYMPMLVSVANIRYFRLTRTDHYGNCNTLEVTVIIILIYCLRRLLVWNVGHIDILCTWKAYTLASVDHGDVTNETSVQMLSTCRMELPFGQRQNVLCACIHNSTHSSKTNTYTTNKSWRKLATLQQQRYNSNATTATLQQQRYNSNATTATLQQQRYNSNAKYPCTDKHLWFAKHNIKKSYICRK